MKQVPIFFIIMSGRRAKDYSTIFSWLKENYAPLNVKNIVMDFEHAVWKSVKEIFPNVHIQGCLFHWTQSLYRKIQDIGLQTFYHEKKDVFLFCRKLMALPFLPAELIEKTFDEMNHPDCAPQLKELLKYLDDQWIRNPHFPIKNWSIFFKEFRTNNDVEGWHN